MDVSLVVMPFAGVERPSLGVSLLKSGLSRSGFSSTIHYFNLKFSKIASSYMYRKISHYEYADSLIGELIFAPFVANCNAWSESFLVEILTDILLVHDVSFEQITELAELSHTLQLLIPSFLDDCVKQILADNPKIIGFTSTFHQTCSSLAVAKLLKKQADVPIIFGGANCEGQMGHAILANFDFVDYVCSGEGDIAFPLFVGNYLKSQSESSEINGIISRYSDELHINMTSPVMEMNSLPYPDFHDFFRELEYIAKDTDPMLSVETSRGCWWGEKFQCTFCGLNGSTMKYRSKSSIRALEEIKFLSTQYGVRTFQIVDNILDMKYFNEFFHMLSEVEPSLDLFYETKSNLSKNQLQILKKAGVSSIQPGIESFSSAILKLMKKGVSAIQNIQTLKWCTELQIFPYWNLLWGFPNEPEHEYERMAILVEKLVHLYPPTWFGRITLDRFSPYFVNSVEHDITNVRPALPYRYVYPGLDIKELSKISYHFDFDYSDCRYPERYTEKLQSKLRFWQNLWSTHGKNNSNVPSLTYSWLFDRAIIIRDTRPCRVSEFFTMEDQSAFIYEICSSLHSLGSIIEKARSRYQSIENHEVEMILSKMVGSNLVIQENDSYLSLATPLNPK